MGKGGGSGAGKGQGKGGCELCCDMLWMSFICVCFILFLGPITLAAGITLLVISGTDVTSNAQMQQMNSAVAAWSSTNNLNNVNALQGATFVATVSSATSVGGCIDGSSNYTLLFNQANTDWYGENQNDFNSVPQGRLQVPVPGNACGWTVTITNTATGTVLATFSQGTPTPLVNIDANYGNLYCPPTVSSCSGSSARACAQNCQNLGGAFTCSGQQWQCTTVRQVNSLCLKVVQSAQGVWQADASQPAAGQGCSPQEAMFADARNPTFGTDLFVYPNLTLAAAPPPSITVLVRNSADPWLLYQDLVQATGGALGSSKTSYIVSGSILLVSGVLLTICWLVAICKWCGMKKRKPDNRPTGFDGYFYDAAYGRPHGGHAAAVPMAPLPPPPPAYGNPGYGTAPPPPAPAPYGAYGSPAAPAGYPQGGYYPPAPSAYPGYPPPAQPYGYPPPPAGYPQDGGYPPAPAGQYAQAPPGYYPK